MEAKNMDKAMSYIGRMDNEGRLSKPSEGPNICAMAMTSQEAFALAQEYIVNTMPEYLKKKYNANAVVSDIDSVMKGGTDESQDMILKMTGSMMAQKFLKESMTTELKELFYKSLGEDGMIRAIYSELFIKLVQYNDVSLACMEMMKTEAYFDDELINQIMEAMIINIRQEIERRNKMADSLMNKFSDASDDKKMDMKNLMSALDEQVMEMVKNGFKSSPGMEDFSIEKLASMDKAEFINTIKDILDKTK